MTLTLVRNEDFVAIIYDNLLQQCFKMIFPAKDHQTALRHAYRLTEDFNSQAKNLEVGAWRIVVDFAKPESVLSYYAKCELREAL